MNKKIMKLSIIAICIFLFFIIENTSDERFKNKQIQTQSNTYKKIYTYDNNPGNKKSVKQLNQDASHIIIYCSYKDEHKIMLKDVYLRDDIKKVIAYINSIEYYEQVQSKEEINDWNFLIYIESPKYKNTISLTFYKNPSGFAYQNDIGGIRIDRDTYDNFVNLYKNLDYEEVHLSDKIESNTSFIYGGV